ncbi:MAG: hypothetical protein IT349_03730 [Candidatus Eisenbacteria bacterium]|nr:hypothetical protein [Candidatus Eisenbacteria bacterium]MCC7141192.1 hypothetical protein [Candidatus Eisenbacteria bacterium]
MAFNVINTKVEWVLEARKPTAGPLLVIPANDHLWMGTGPGLEIKKAHGKELEVEAVRQGPVEPGAVVETSAGGTGFQRLLHAAVLDQENHWVPGAGRLAARAMVEAAERLRASELIAYPFHRGAHVRPEVALPEMLSGLLDALERGSSVRRVVVLAADATEQTVLQQTFLQALSSRT